MRTYFLPLRAFKAGQGVTNESNNYSNGQMLVISRWEHKKNVDSAVDLGKAQKAFQNC